MTEDSSKSEYERIRDANIQEIEIQALKLIQEIKAAKRNLTEAFAEPKKKKPATKPSQTQVQEPRRSTRDRKEANYREFDLRDEDYPAKRTAEKRRTKVISFHIPSFLLCI